MTQTKKTIYAVVTLATPCTEWFDLRVYSKQTSNLEIMKAYKEEIKRKHPSCRVHLVTRERAKEIQKEFRQHLRDVENRKLAELDRRLNNLAIIESYLKSTERRA